MVQYWFIIVKITTFLVIIFIINRNLEFEFLNQTTQHILGYSPQEIQGQNCGQFDGV